MRMSLFAAFRSRDGRSLARALAVFVLVNAIAAGLHTGLMADPATAGPVLCLPSGADTAFPATGTGHGGDCCFSGCCPPMLPLLGPDRLAIFAPPAHGAPDARTLAEAAPQPRPILSDAAPRGPPALA